MTRLKTAEWQTRTVCSFIAAQAQIDTSQTGGKNPLLEEALTISITPRAASQDTGDDPRGEQTGWVSDKESRQMVAAAGRSAPLMDTRAADEDGNMTGSPLGAEMTPEEEAIGAAAQPGSFEGFLAMFGGGGVQAPGAAPGPQG